MRIDVFLSCVGAYPLVLLVLESLAFTTSAAHTTFVSSILQLLLRSVNVIYQGVGKMIHIAIGQVLRTALIEVFVKASVGRLPAQT